MKSTEAVELLKIATSALVESLERTRNERDEARKLYDDLLFAVERKHPNESRHETARRYIRNAESLVDGPGYDAAVVPPKVVDGETQYSHAAYQRP